MPRRPSTDLFGFSKARIHELLQRWGWGRGGAELAREVLSISDQAAGELVDALEREGYVQKCTKPHVSPGWEYELTLKGTSFGQARTGAELARALARRHLHELVERMDEVNRDDRFLLGVEEASVFGEYLTDAQELGVLDVQYTTYRKIEERGEFARARDRAARASGQRFSREMDLRLWPENEVRDHLQGQSAVYRFSTNTERARDAQMSRLLIFRDRAPVHDWRKL
jgi:DNA-binding HxlR family transcriptional regulator